MSDKRRFIKASAFIVACSLALSPVMVNASGLNSRLNDAKDQVNSIDGEIYNQNSAISEVQAKINQQLSQQESVQSILNTLSSQRLDYEQQIGILNFEIQQSVDLIYELNDQILDITNDIEIKQVEIDKLKENISNTTELLRDRLRAMYKLGDAEKIEVLLASKDINDFLSRNKMMTTITEYDQNLIQKLKDQKTELDLLVTELNGKKKALEIAEENAKKEKSQLETKREAQEALLDKIKKEEADNYELLAALNSKIDEYEAHLNEKLAEKSKLNSQKASISAEIANIESEIEANRLAEAARQQEAQKAREKAESESRAQRREEELLDQLASKKEEAQQIEQQIPQAPSYTGAVFGWPTVNTYISAYFMDPTYQYGPAHKGIDIPASTGSPIYAVADGVVKEANYSYAGWGNQVLIDHGNGIWTRYAHMDTLPPVSVGQYVTRGQYIGPIGDTGYSFGSHLHFEVWKNGVRVDPMLYLR